MDVRRIATESPKADQWRLLAQFAYPTNICRYLENHGFAKTDPKTVEFIAGCVRQGEAYFAAAENSPLDIAPLLLYYGAVNLLAGASGMITGVRPAIEHHGMKLEPPDTEPIRIKDAKVKPFLPKNGALQQFCNVFSSGCVLPSRVPWTVEEILGSIPDLKRDFENCYPDALPYTIPVEIVRRRQGSLERIVPSEVARYQTPQEALDCVAGFADAYLAPQYSEQMNYIVLRRKMGAAEIGTYSIFGQKHLQIAHIKNGQYLSPNQIIVIFMGLFALGYLSRYHPELWNPFVRSDETGEKLVIERFLAICQRYLPNLVLDVIRGERIQFVYETEGVLDLTTSPTESDLNEMLEKKIRDMRIRGRIG